MDRAMIEHQACAVEGLRNIGSITDADQPLGAQRHQRAANAQGEHALVAQSEAQVGEGLEHVDAGRVCRPGSGAHAT
jgi:hypothetical protein